MSDAVHTTSRDPGFLLREKEIAQFTEILSRREFTVVVLTGETNTGKSTLMRHVRHQGEDLGWKAIPAADQRDVSVISVSTDESFTADIGQLVNLTAVTPVTLAQRIGELQPVLILIEAHGISPPFSRWFASTFIDGMKVKHISAIVVVVTDIEADVRSLGPVTDVVITLGPFSASAVSKELARISANLLPPISSEELEAYTKQARTNPMILASLGRLLTRAAQRSAPEQTPETEADRV
jgi:hypothetical protein